MNNSNMPAMPIVDKGGNPKNANIGSYEFECRGLTKREHFAAMAMQGMISAKAIHRMPEEAVAFADALLKELDK